MLLTQIIVLRFAQATIFFLRRECPFRHIIIIIRLITDHHVYRLFLSLRRPKSNHLYRDRHLATIYTIIYPNEIRKYMIRG